MVAPDGEPTNGKIQGKRELNQRTGRATERSPGWQEGTNIVVFEDTSHIVENKRRLKRVMEGNEANDGKGEN